MLDIVVSQGRLGDRSGKTIEGAARTAGVLEQRYGVKARLIGKQVPPEHDDWRSSLPQARDTLVGLREALIDSFKSRNIPVMVANTCSVGLATLPVVARHHPDAVVIWIDAHGDFNTPETTDSGYLGGMVLAAACGLWSSGHGNGLKATQVVIVGARDIDAAERELLIRNGVRTIAPSDASPSAVLSAIGNAPVWIHVDWDAMEPGHIPADYQVVGGLLPMQLRQIFAAVPPGNLIGLEIAEFHPSINEFENTAALANIVDIVAPLLDPLADLTDLNLVT